MKMIYIIQQEGENIVKIGFTTDIKKRLQHLQDASAHKLNVVLLIKGTFQKERDLHDEFGEYRIRGEWYYLSDSIKKFIKLNYKQDLVYEEGLKVSDINSCQTTYIRTLGNLGLREVGLKMGITPQSVREIEIRELHKGVSLATLEKYGKCLGYQLVYKFIKSDEE